MSLRCRSHEPPRHFCASENASQPSFPKRKGGCPFLQCRNLTVSSTLVLFRRDVWRVEWQSTSWPSRISSIASDRVEGTAVRRPSGDMIGHIERLMIDKVTGKVSYAILSFGGFLGLGANLIPLPWGRLRYNTRFEAYELDIDNEELKRAPSLCSQGFRLGRSRQGSGAASLLWHAALLGRLLVAGACAAGRARKACFVPVFRIKFPERLLA